MSSVKKGASVANRAPRKKPEAFPAVKDEVPYGVVPDKRPLLYEVIAPYVMMADVSGGVTPWLSTRGRSVSQIRSAAKAWGYRINVSTTKAGEVVFRLNGKLSVAAPIGKVTR